MEPPLTKARSASSCQTAGGCPGAPSIFQKKENPPSHSAVFPVSVLKLLVADSPILNRQNTSDHINVDN